MPLWHLLIRNIFFTLSGHCGVLSISQSNATSDSIWLGKRTPLHFLPSPPTPPSSIVASQRLKIVTGGDEISVASQTARDVIANQRAFAQRHGYAYEVHSGNYAYPWIAYWHKIDVLLRELQAPRPPEVLVWFDLDLVVTNPALRMLEDILASHPNEEVILTEDAHRGNPIPGNELAKRFVNTGVILIRSGNNAQRVLEELLGYGRKNRNAAYMPQDTDTLHEQDAFNSILSGPRKHVWRRHVAVIPQRNGGLNLNTFARHIYTEDFKDPSDAEWQAGDFTAHCTGLRTQLREWCIADSVEAAAEMVASAEKGPSADAVDVYKMASIQAFLDKGIDVLESNSISWSKPSLISRCKLQMQFSHL